MRVALFVTCVNNGLFPATGRAVVSVLERLGQQVVFPEPQTCCGQLHINAGYRPEGLRLARGVVDVFASCDAVVVPSASCAGTIRAIPGIAADAGDAALADAARELAGRVYELSELLVDVLGITDVGASFPHRVAYHPTCHSLRVLRLGERPLRLLAAVRGLELAEVAGAEACCGFGGAFSFKNPETSVAMGADKLAALQASGAEVICAADNSCLSHLGGLATRRRLPLRTRHLAEILASTPGREWR